MSESGIVQDFLVESYENLDRLDRELVGPEKNPKDKDALAGVFRTIHTIKGTCGFLGFNKLEKVAHVGENLLTRLRDGQLTLNPECTTALLSMVDAVRQMLKEIESTGQDGEIDYAELRETLTRLQKPVAGDAGSVPGAEAASPAPAPTGSKAEGKLENPATPPKQAAQREAVAPETIRVGVNLLDKLMTLVGELVLARNQLLQISNTVEDTGLQAVSQRMNLMQINGSRTFLLTGGEEALRHRQEGSAQAHSQFAGDCPCGARGNRNEDYTYRGGSSLRRIPDRPGRGSSHYPLHSWFHLPDALHNP
jgi:two-component system chemotaxis sensor kinase CheA